MRARVPSFVAILLGAVTAACGTSGPSPAAQVVPTTSPAVTALPSPTPGATQEGWTSFTSTRHGYSVDVPPGWRVNAYEGSWTRLDEFDPGAEVVGEDSIAPPTFYAFLVVNSMPIPAGVSAAEWQAGFDARVAAGTDPACPVTTRLETFAGELASVGEQACGTSILIGRSLTHAGRGYYFTVRFPASDPYVRETLDRVLASVRFTTG